MEIEYSKHGGYAYSFTKQEEKIISRALTPEIKKLDKKIEKVRNDPKNEGQVTYQAQIEELTALRDSLIDMQKNFK